MKREKKGTELMTDERGIADRWSEFRPSKPMGFWSMAGAAVATMIVGFTVGGWTTGGSAQTMADVAARDAKAELASAICVEKFLTETSAAENLARLKDQSTYQQDDFIEEGGWVTLVGIDTTVPGAADLCADELVALESLPPREVTAGASSADG